MFTTASLPLGGRWRIRGRTWVITQRDEMGDVQWRIHLCDPFSGLLASAELGRAAELPVPRLLQPSRETHVSSPTDGWEGYTVGDFTSGQQLSLAGFPFHIVEPRPRGDHLNLTLETPRLNGLRRKAEEATRNGDFEQAGQLLYGGSPSSRQRETAVLFLPLRTEE